jgi:hypothetical protein
MEDLSENFGVLQNSTKVKNRFTEFVTISFSERNPFYEVSVNEGKYRFVSSCFDAPIYIGTGL